MNFELFTTFFKIGLFTLGGGYAMIPMIEQAVVERNHWLKSEEMVDLIAIAQSCPGVFAVNISIFVGNKLLGTRGALMAALVTVLPSFLIILAIAMFFHSFQDNRVVAAIFRGIRPAVVALIAAPVFTLARKAGVTLRTVWIPVVAAGLIWLFGVSPVLVILAALLLGWIYSKMKGTAN